MTVLIGRTPTSKKAAQPQLAATVRLVDSVRYDPNLSGDAM